VLKKAYHRKIMENPTTLAMKKIENNENKTLAKLQMNISKLVKFKKILI
jgi:hypothetical protein